MEALDPLNLDTQWDDAYQHLLDQANDLLELGDLARAEADEFAEADSAKERPHRWPGELPSISTTEGEFTIDDEVPDVVQFCGHRDRL